jgi:hypothetical protein
MSRSRCPRCNHRIGPLQSLSRPKKVFKCRNCGYSLFIPSVNRSIAIFLWLGVFTIYSEYGLFTYHFSASFCGALFVIFLYCYMFSVVEVYGDFK